jgi:hypothetical protein
MIIEWLKKKWATAIIEKEKRGAIALAERKREQEKETSEWREKYFRGIVFPIVILAKKDYLAVSDLVEYYYDTDINIWFVKSDYELVDSIGQKYDFKQIDRGQWVPHNKTGIIEYEELMDRLIPLLYMPNHKKKINTTRTIKDIIELLLEGE